MRAIGYAQTGGPDVLDQAVTDVAAAVEAGAVGKVFIDVC